MKIRISIFPDKRLNGPVLKMKANISWPGGSKKITLPDHYSPLRDDYDFDKRTIHPNASEQSKKAWDRIVKLKEYTINITPEEPYQGIAMVQAYTHYNETPAPIEINTITGYVKEFIELKKSTYAYNTIRGYQTLIRNIIYYCHYTNTSDVIMPDRTSQIVWFSRYVDFLLNEEIFEIEDVLHQRVYAVIGRDFRGKKIRYQNDSVKNEFKLLDSVFGVFKDSGIKVELSMFHANLRTPQKESPYYEIEQLVDMIKYKASGLAEKVLDIAIFQSFTGVRYSELYQIEDANITVKMIDGTKRISIWNYVQGKGGIPKSVPLNDICIGILNKWRDRDFVAPSIIVREPRNTYKQDYPDCLLPIIAEQTFNREIKKVLQNIASFQGVQKEICYYGSERVEQSIPQYNLFSSHSARHTFSHMLYINGLTMGEVGELINSQATSEKYYKHIQKDVLHLKALEVLNKVG